MANTAHRSRFSIDLPEDWQIFLAETAKRYRITQGDVIELMLANMPIVNIEDKFKARREQKLAARKSKRSLTAQFRELPPEQQAEALKALRVSA